MVNHSYDFVDLLPVREYVENLVKVCGAFYEDFERKVVMDEEKNKKLSSEYREYEYGGLYGTQFVIWLYYNGRYDGVKIERAADFSELVARGELNDVSNLRLEITVNFRRGVGNEAQEHRHSYKIVFQALKNNFTYAANCDDEEMQLMEKKILGLLEDFPAVKTIFTKG